jgi:nicotinate-nucleotide adenylyltransferase
MATGRSGSSAVASIGILGGAFNPPHIGHLVLAHEAAFQLALDSVVLMPVGEAPHKVIRPEPGREVRLELVRAVAADDDLLEVSELEVRADGPSYSVNTLAALHEERPDDELTFLMGADVAAGLESWREPERVLELARLGIAGRPGTVLDEAEAALDRLGGRERAEIVPMPEIDISSTRVRRRIADGRPIRYVVPDPVRALIEERGLYREAVRA